MLRLFVWLQAVFFVYCTFICSTVAAQGSENTGALLISGGSRGVDAESAKRFMELAGGNGAHVVVLFSLPHTPSNWAAERKYQLTICEAEAVESNPLCKRASRPLRALHLLKASVITPHESGLDTNQLAAVLDDAGGVWIEGDSPKGILEDFPTSTAWDALEGVLKRGGIIGGGAAAGEAMTSFMAPHDGTSGGFVVDRGFELVPDLLMETANEPSRELNQVKTYISAHPETAVISLDDGCAVIIRQGQVQPLDIGEVTVITASRENDPLTESRLSWGLTFDLTTRMESFTPLTLRSKFHESIGPILRPRVAVQMAIGAAISQAEGAPSQWGGDLAGYGQRYGAIAAVLFSRQSVLFGASVVAHEDLRRFRSDASGFWPRTGAAIGHAFEVRRDDGRMGFAYARFASDLAAGTVGEALYQNGGVNGRTLVGLVGASVSAEVFGSLIYEFGPDIRARLRLRRLESLVHNR